MTPRQSFSTILRQLADLSDIRGDSTDAADLRRAAGALDSHPAPRPARLNLALERRLLGKAERSTANSALTAADLEMALRTRLARVPWLLRRLVEWAVASTSEAAGLARAGIATLPDLTTALDEGLIAHQFGVEIDGRVRAVADRLSAELQPITLGRACAIVDAVLERLTAVCPALENVTASGGMRRCEPLVESLIIVGCAAEPQSVIDVIAALPEVDDVLHRNGRRVVFAHKQTEIDVRIAPADQYGSVLHATTGCRAHLATMASRQTRSRLFSREEDVYADSGLPFIAAELRQGTGEIEAAAAGRLPSLISLEQIRGDLHMHSTYSDGQDALEVMVAASSALGYEYIAVTDHSERAGAARTVTRDTLARQRDEIARLRERYPSIAILHGIEVDIMPRVLPIQIEVRRSAVDLQRRAGFSRGRVDRLEVERISRATPHDAIGRMRDDRDERVPDRANAPPRQPPRVVPRVVVQRREGACAMTVAVDDQGNPCGCAGSRRATC